MHDSIRQKYWDEFEQDLNYEGLDARHDALDEAVEDGLFFFFATLKRTADRWGVPHIDASDHIRKIDMVEEIDKYVRANGWPVS